MQRVEALHVVQLVGLDIRVGERRHSEVTERVFERCAAVSASQAWQSHEVWSLAVSQGHVFQGGLPDAHKLSSAALSRIVSIAPQKPWCLKADIWRLRTSASIGPFS